MKRRGEQPNAHALAQRDPETEHDLLGDAVQEGAEGERASGVRAA
jgi:hypothetical protein